MLSDRSAPEADTTDIAKENSTMAKKLPTFPVAYTHVTKDMAEVSVSLAIPGEVDEDCSAELAAEEAAKAAIIVKTLSRKYETGCTIGGKKKISGLEARELIMTKSGEYARKAAEKAYLADKAAKEAEEAKAAKAKEEAAEEAKMEEATKPRPEVKAALTANGKQAK
jgi:hypothetical protein